MNIDIFELRREIFHVLVGIMFVIIILFIPYSDYILFIILLVGALLSFLSTQFNIPLISHSLCLFERECNKKFPGKGVLFFFLGSLIAIKLFERNIAIASILILTFSDSVSHFIGRNFGRVKSSFNGNKKIEGTIAGILAGTLFASFFVNPLLAFLGSLFAMILELAGVKMGNEQVDDNLLIPIIAGTIMHLVTIL